MLKKPGVVALTLGLLGASLAFAQPQVEIEYLGSFGGFGKTEAGKFDWPVAIAFDDQSRIIIADNNNDRVQRCTAQGDCEVFGRRGSQLGQFIYPLGVAVDSLGRLIVSEAGNDRIQLRDSSGQWTSFGSTGKDGPPGQFRLPAGIAVDDQDRIVVADEKNHRIQVCNDKGACTAFGSQGPSLGSFDTPRAVAVTSQGRILVADFWNYRVQSCSYTGACTSFGEVGSAPGQFLHPSGVAVDGQDRVFVSDRDNYRFQVCDLSGVCVAFGEFGSGPGQFQQPEAVAVDGQNRIYVADVVNQNIQIFQATYTDDTQPGAFQINAGLNDAWYNPATAGQGFLITVFPDIGQMFLAWFTYDLERPDAGVTAQLGEPGHRWLTAQGPYADNQAVLDVWVSSGGAFNSAQPVVTPAKDGEIVIEFSDCNAGTVSYDIASVDRQGVIPIERVALDNVALCESLNSQLQAE